MQISSRFTIAVHILTCIKYFEGHIFITSEFLAGSIGVNPVIIRQIIIKLKKAGIVKVGRGRGSFQRRMCLVKSSVLKRLLRKWKHI